MNVIVVTLDSFRQDHVGVYHGGKEVFPRIEPCRTPNLDRFASEAIVFENMYPEGLPTVLDLIDEHRSEAERLARSFGPCFRRGRSARVKGVQETCEMGSASVE